LLARVEKRYKYPVKAPTDKYLISPYASQYSKIKEKEKRYRAQS
jgi:hypothetical protein